VSITAKEIEVATLFTGIQPTGFLHIGNYFGAIKNWVKMQYEYDSYISVVDYHAITILYEVDTMPRNVFEMVLGLYACGIDFERTTLFIQSEVPGHAELTWIFNSVIPLGELERMTQFKDKARQNRANVNIGLLDYPVLQAADILIYKGDVVPVGEDQVQHVEFAREVARKFNVRYGETFPECKALLTQTPRVMGLDGSAKMSKSKDNYIALFESKEEIWKKVSVAKTDPARKRKTDPGTPEICNIYALHGLVTPKKAIEEVAEGCRSAGIGCLDCKKIFVENLMTVLDPIQERYKDFSSRKQEVRKVLTRNAAHCREVAKSTILEVKQKMGLSPVWEI
jgi:tryptophanyl-tRNA synthetase